MLRLLSRGRKQAEGDEEPKHYKKANLGLSNKMYYNEELKMWVERGKEEEARVEKAKLNAPPPSVGSMSAASSSTSLATMSDAASAAGGPAPALNFSRAKGLSGRYVNVSTIPTAPAGGAGPTPGGSPAPKTLLPGMGGPKLSGIPAAPGSGPPSFFKPTPAASEADSNALGGSNIGSVSGLSGLDPSFPSSRNPSQPNFFIPAAVPSTSSPTTTEDTQGAGAGDETSQGEGVRTSSGSGVVAHPRGSSDGGAGFAMRESDTSGSGRLPAMSGPSNVSFASWQHLRESGTGSPAAAATGAVPQVPEVPAAGEHGLLQASSSADSQPDAQAEVSSPAPGLYPGKQQQPQQSWGSADSNGNGFYMPGPVVGPTDNAATEQLANGNHSTGADAQQPQPTEQQPLDSQLSNSWDARPNKDPFDSAAEGLVQAAGWDTTEGYDWEGGGQGGEWGHQQTPVVQYPNDGYPMEGQQPQDPLATGTAADAGTGWGMQQQPGGWTGQQDGWERGWGADAAAGAVDAEGGAAAASSTPAAADGDASAWQEQQQPVDGAWQQQQPVDGTWQQQQPVDNTWQQHEQQAADGSWQQQQQQQQPVQAADGQQACYSGYGEQYAGATGWEGQQYGASTPAADGSYYQTQKHAQGQDGTGAYSGYYQAAAAAGGEQPAVEVLEPVHPQLPGIAVAGTGSGGVSSPTYAPPGTGGSSGSRGSRAGMRHTSMPGSPLAHQTSMGTLLPQPPRHSAGGLTTQRSMGHDGQAGAAAVVLPTAAAAGDSSLLNTFRPSSPYARAVSPLSRTSTGMGDATAVGKQSSGGFPIPSPPSHGGLLSSRAPSGNMFIPANVAAAATAAVGATGVPAPWQPGTVAATGSKFMQPQQQQDFGMVNGYDAAAQGHWQQQQQQYETQQQQQEEQQEQASGYNQQQQLMPPVPSGNSPAAVPPFMPGLLESLPRDAPPSAGRDGTQQQPFMPQAPGSATATAGKRRGAERAHPYDQFLSQALSQVNWRAVHFKQPGKLNKMLPWEEFEMEKALQEEAEKQARGQSRGSPFWYRQMEFRQKLPPDSMRPSASEPAHMPSHAVNRVPPNSAAESAASQVSAYPGWPNSGELQRQQQQQYQQQYQQLAVPGSPLTPARAATTGAVGAVAAYQQHEEPTPTSRLMTPTEHAPVAEAEAAAAAGAEQAGVEGEQQQQQQWAGWEGYGEQGQQAANGYWQQQYDPRYAEQYGQYTGYEQQQYYDDQQQQYDMSQWQQQQQEQQQPAEAGVAVEQAGVGPEGWSMEAGAVDRGATWGSPDAEMLAYGATGAQDAEAAAAQQDYCAARQQEYSAAAQQEYPAAAQQDYTAATQLGYSAAQQDYSAAAANGAAGAWGADDAALDLQLGVGVDIAASASAAAAAALAEAAASSAAAPAAGHEWFAPEVIAAARAARISSSSVGLESQPSTGRAAAAAAKRIVSGALDNIMQQYAAVPEEAEQEEAAAAAAAAAEYGWQGAEAAAAAAAVAGEGWEGAEVLEQAEGMGENAGEEPADGEAAAAATAEEDAGGEVAAAPTSAAWLRLAQQFNTAAEAAAAKGQLQENFAQYQDLFMQYGQYLLSVLPHDALERAGLLAEEPAAAAAEEEEEVEAEEDPDLLAEFGALELKNSAAEGMFASLGFELDTLFECCA